MTRTQIEKCREVHRRRSVVVVSGIVVPRRHRVRRCRRMSVRGSSTLIVSIVVGHRCWPVLVVVGVVVVVPSSSSLYRQ